MIRKKLIMTAAVIMLLSIFTTATADNLQKLSEDVRRIVVQTQRGHRAADAQNGKLCVFIRFNGGDAEQLLAKYGCEKVTQIDDIYIVNVPVDQLAALAACEAVERIETNTSGRMMLDVAPKWVENKPVHSGLELPQGYDGTGVLMGIVDCGFDLTHPTLFADDGTTYRLKGLVDGYRAEGEAVGKETPLGMEFLDAKEMQAKKYTNDLHNNHGTHCIGIAAGSGYGTPYRGIAYGTDIFAISSKNASEDYLANSADQTARMKRIFDYADEQKMPCVITYSIGFSALPNDSQLFAEALDKLVGPGRILVAAAGNENMECRHLSKKAGEAKGSALYVYGSQGKAISYLTADKPFQLKCFTVKIVGNADGETYHYEKTDSLVFDSSALPTDTVVVGSLHALLENKGAYYWLTVRDTALLAYNIPFELTGDANVTLNTVSTYFLMNIEEELIGSTRFTGAIKNHNVGLPGNLESSVTVGALNGRTAYTNYKDSLIAPFGLEIMEGTIAPFSSCGPTSDGRIKPDVVAPGVNIISAGNRYCEGSYGKNVVTMTEFNGQQFPWIANSGTSMATPCAAGVVALWLQADPTLTPQRIKEIIKKTSKKIEGIDEWPNNTYGHGIIDAYAGIVEVIKGSTGIQHISSHQPTALTIRPAEGRQVRLTFNQAPQKSVSITVYSVAGSKLSQQTLAPTGATTYTISVPQAQAGLHIIQVNSAESGMTGSEIIRWD